MTKLFFHDYEQHGLDGAVLLVSEHLANCGDFEIVATTSRNALLEKIADSQRGEGVALIDLQRDNHARGNYVGLRIVQAIRHHPTLAARCRPMALTRWDDDTVIKAVREIGAYGLVRRDELERALGAPEQLDLAGKLSTVAKRPCVPPGGGIVPYCVIPEESEMPIGAATPTEDEDMAVVREFFPGLPKRANFEERDWSILRHYREVDDRGVVVQWVADECFLSTKTIENRIDRMRDEAAIVYRTPRPDLGRLADDLLARLPHRRTPPGTAALFAELPDPVSAMLMCADAPLVRAAWIQQPIIDAIIAVRRRWVDPKDVATGKRKTTSLLDRTAALRQAIIAASKDTGADLTRTYAYGVQQLLDAQSDNLRRR